MKNTIAPKAVAAMVLLAISSGSLAEHGRQSDRRYTDRHYDYARVTHVKPVYESYSRKVPHEECWVETVRYDRDSRQHRSATGTILGGIIGAAVGNKLGHKKRNKQVGAVAGAILGASIGRDVSRRRQGGGQSVSEYRDVERCETRYSHETEERLVGYHVTYRYGGNDYRTTTDEHPGKRLKVAVSVEPVY